MDYTGNNYQEVHWNVFRIPTLSMPLFTVLLGLYGFSMGTDFVGYRFSTYVHHLSLNLYAGATFRLIKKYSRSQNVIF